MQMPENDNTQQDVSESKTVTRATTAVPGSSYRRQAGRCSPRQEEAETCRPPGDAEKIAHEGIAGRHLGCGFIFRSVSSPR